MKDVAVSIDTKAQEIALAVIKISVYVRRKEMRERLERLAFSLVEGISAKNADTLFYDIPSLKALISLGKTLYEVEPINAALVLDGLDDLYEVFKKGFLGGDVPEAESGNKKEAITSNKKNTAIESNSKKEDVLPNKDNSAIEPNKAKESNSATNNGLDNAAIRQSAIFDKVNEFNNKSVQLKDIIPLFPEVSERTLRYDLQRLCSDGKMVRVGQGGPATYYKIRSL